MEKAPRRELQIRAANLPARIDHARANAVLARADAILARRVVAPATTAPASAHGAEIVVAPMTCSARGTSYLVLLERHENRLLIVGHKLTPPGAVAIAQSPLHGEYQLSVKAGWACPHCGYNGWRTWVCRCLTHYASLHCFATVDGTEDGRRHCACGKTEQRHMQQAATLPVGGRSLGISSG